MKHTLPLGSLEKEIMDCVWNHKEQSVRQIYLCINKRRRVAYTTVMTVMNRLVAKGFLTRQRLGKAYLYSPKLSKSQAIKTHLHQVLIALITNYGYEAVAAFADEIDNLPNKEKQILLKRLQRLK